MRSLEEWTKYLERQEQAVREALSGEPTVEREEPEPEPAKPEPKQRAAGPTHTSAKSGEVEALPGERDSPAGARDSRKGARAAASPVRLKNRVREARSLPDGGPEVAQGSYKPFRETREDLLGRLLDPELNLEDAARLLNVCPTTVRRYTNKGVLKHYRTAGNQRRFRLSDVLEFLERHGIGGFED